MTWIALPPRLWHHDHVRGEPPPSSRHPLAGKNGRIAMVAMIHRDHAYGTLNDTTLAALIAARTSGAVRPVTARTHHRSSQTAFTILGNIAGAGDAVRGTSLPAFATRQTHARGAGLSPQPTPLTTTTQLGT